MIRAIMCAAICFYAVYENKVKILNILINEVSVLVFNNRDAEYSRTWL